MDLNGLKKSIIESASIFGGLIILLACIAGINYIASIYPIVALSIALAIFFCVSVILHYLIV